MNGNCIRWYDGVKQVSTYGKTIHTWQVDRGDTLPLGAPQLMMSPTADGQVSAYNVSVPEISN